MSKSFKVILFAKTHFSTSFSASLTFYFLKFLYFDWMGGGGGGGGGVGGGGLNIFD